MNRFIDHTLLKPDVTENDIFNIMKEANDEKFRTICISPSNLELVQLLKENFLEGDFGIATVIGFPHGNSTIKSKIQQIKQYKIDEYDVVLNFGNVKSKKWNYINEELEEIRNSTNKIVKYIVEVGYLTDDELFEISDLLIYNKIDFIKTCTGYGPRNVEINDIIKIKKYVGDRIKIKASGGIKTLEFAKQLIEAGADRLGTSSSVSIMKEIKGENNNDTKGKDIVGTDRTVGY